MDQDVWSRARHTRRGPPQNPSLCLLFIRWGPGASSPWKRLECREAQRAGSPPLRHQSKRLIWSPANGQRHPWRARRTSAGCQHSLTRAAEWSAQHDLCTHTQHIVVIIVVIMKGDFRCPPRVLLGGPESRHPIKWFSISHLVRSSPGFRSRSLPANRRQGSIPSSRRWQSRALPLGEASAGPRQFIRLSRLCNYCVSQGSIYRMS